MLACQTIPTSGLEARYNLQAQFIVSWASRGSMNRTPTPDELNEIHRLIGQSICALQFLEEALNILLSMKIDLKTPGIFTKAEAQDALAKRARSTLGIALKNVRDYSVMSPMFMERLTRFTEERNWLVHRSLDSFAEGLYSIQGRTDVSERLSKFLVEAEHLKKLIVSEIYNFSESHGIDTDGATRRAHASLRKLKGEA